jgi:hypothetical protein
MNGISYEMKISSMCDAYKTLSIPKQAPTTIQLKRKITHTKAKNATMSNMFYYP